MQFNLDPIGRPSAPSDFPIERDRAIAYAQATNDPTPAHLDGTLAPPVFAVVPAWGAMSGVIGEVVPADALMTVVHGEQDMHFHRPIEPGTTLRTVASAAGVSVKPSGTTVVVKVESRDAVTDELMVSQYVTTFYRGVTGGEGGGEEAPDHKLTAAVKAGEPVATVEQTIDADQTFRYAEASGDHMPIHLDDEFARKVGLPGIIVHGLCTMAFTSSAAIGAVADGDPRRLRRLAVRFSRPVLPGQTIVTTFWDAGTRDGTRVFGYETRTAEGDVVIKDGLVEVAG